MFPDVSCTIAAVDADNRKRLGRAVVARRTDLGMRTTKALAELADLSPRMLGDVENGRRDNFSAGAKAQIERALRWDPGSIDRVLEGKEPSVSGVIRGKAGQLIETFTAVDGFEQHNLRRLRLGAIIMDARDLVQSQRGPLMTALASILDEASDLVIRVIAEDDDDVIDARWRIDQVRAGNSIRRQGDVYFVDELANASIEVDEPLLVVAHDGSERLLLQEALLGYYVDMFLRALEDSTRDALVNQALQVLGDDVDPGQVIAPEIADSLYVTYIAARHSAIQGGDPTLHTAAELTAKQRESAAARYQRERSEMILFDGHIRTAGAPANAIAEAIHRVAPPGYKPGQSGQGDANGEEDQDDI